MVTIQWLFVLGAAALFYLTTRRRPNEKDVLPFLRGRPSRVTGDSSTTTFSDVAGVDEAKQELAEIVEFLARPSKFRPLGARVPTGVLLIGPPGTGKTLLARAVAGEAHVPFYAASGSEFVELFVGVGASRIRNLFVEAKRHAPAIIFIDEIDAVGRRRSSDSASSSQEHEQTLNQVLVEMDGFETNEGVIVIGATNRPDTLDPALIRPGRFDRQIVVDVPDAQGRDEILRVRAVGKPFDETVDFSTVAALTAGFTGADLANLVNESAILAARYGKSSIGITEIEDALDRMVAGPNRRSRVIGEREKIRLAYHEVGHALVARLMPDAEAAPRHSIRAPSPRSSCASLAPRDDRRLWSRSQMESALVVTVSGTEAERLIFGETSTRASHDLERATQIAMDMVTVYGMNDELGPLALGNGAYGELHDHGENIAREIDRHVDAFVRKAAERARTLLVENRAELATLAEKLASEDTLDAGAIDTMINPPTMPETDVAISVSPPTDRRGKGQSA